MNIEQDNRASEAHQQPNVPAQRPLLPQIGLKDVGYSANSTAWAAFDPRERRLASAATVVKDGRVTSTFALAWAEGRVGQTQSHRRFLDYVIDGDSFYRRHGQDLISILGWFIPAEEHLAAQRLLGTSPPDFDGRTAISVCPEDGDLLCGALTARIVIEGNEIQWLDLALSYYDHDNETWQHDPVRLADGPELRFDAEQYRSAISQCLRVNPAETGQTNDEQRDPQGKPSGLIWLLVLLPPGGIFLWGDWLGARTPGWVQLPVGLGILTATGWLAYRLQWPKGYRNRRRHVSKHRGRTGA